MADQAWEGCVSMHEEIEHIMHNWPPKTERQMEIVRMVMCTAWGDICVLLRKREGENDAT